MLFTLSDSKVDAMKSGTIKSRFPVLILMFIVGCAGLEVRQKENMSMPSMIVKRAIEYLGSDQADTDAREKGFTGDQARGKYLPEDLILDSLEYSPVHKHVEVTFILKASFAKTKKLGETRWEDGHETVSVRFDPSGHCTMWSAGQCSCTHEDMVQRQRIIPSGQDYEHALLQVQRLIRDGKVHYNCTAKDDLDEIPSSEFSNDPEAEAEFAKLEKIIKARIPERLRLEHLALARIEPSRSGDETEVVFTVLPSVVNTSWSEAECITLTFLVDRTGVCKEYTFSRNLQRIDSSFTLPLPSVENNKQQDDIFEAVFRHMFTDEAIVYDGKIKMRFLTIGPMEFLKDPFFERFKDDKIPSRSPYKRYTDYKGTWNLNQYIPNFEDAILYEINGITPFDKDHVFVRGTVRWGSASGSNNIYTVAKVKNRWKVIREQMVSFF